MPNLTANGITIDCETAGDPRGMPMLLIAGTGLQLTAWPRDLVDGLVDLGYYVVRFDNRDCGLSAKMSQGGTPNLTRAWLRAMFRLPVHSPYSLEDMAADTLGVLDALGLAKAHVVGLSMGGMIAQILAARHPERVLTLTSIMSSSGRRGLPGSTSALRKAILRRARDLSDHRELVEHVMDVSRLLGSPAYPTSDKHLREQVESAIARNVCRSGQARQMAAVMAGPARTALLRQIACPTLVIHGAADPMVPPACGVDTARLAPDARLEVIEGMGHDLPAQLIERVLALIDMHARGKMTADSLPRLFEKQ
jgi:pimeloyl-ACP methyl ester carboxylesterase